jgi:transcriptional regulator with PAS, ATPase and Fis domain
LDDSFFKLNGNSCQIAFLERNDVLDIGYNKFVFRQCSSELNQSNSVIPKQVVESTLPILIEGETGTGKTRLARIIHEESLVTGSFVHLNLSSFSAQLIESELFGHVKGAFTGASQDRKGAILEANKGTLYLDEIDSLSLDLQTKLLLFLESREFRPVGLDRTILAQVRIICSSGQDLKKLVAAGKMRSDFYFRINNGYKVMMPGLSKNPNLIEKICRDFEIEKNVYLTNELIEFYKKLRWPGNIRELRAHLMKKVVLAEGKKLLVDDVDLELLTWSDKHLPVNNLNMTLEELKLSHTYSVFYQHNQNLKLTSEILGVSPNTVRSILSKKIA